MTDLRTIKFNMSLLHNLYQATVLKCRSQTFRNSCSVGFSNEWRENNCFNLRLSLKYLSVLLVIFNLISVASVALMFTGFV